MLLTDYQVLVINLDRRPDRWKHIQNVLKNSGFRDVQRITAVDGKSLSTQELNRFVTPAARETLHRRRIHHEELGSLGAVGCYLSHVNAWKLVLAKGTPVIVMEDDAILAPTLPRHNVFSHPEEVLTPFDLVLLGYAMLRTDERWNGLMDSNGVSPLKDMFFGTHFYYITPKGAQLLLENAFPIRMQVDSYMGTKVVDGSVKSGVHTPNLSWQRANDTDIQTPCYGCDHSNGGSEAKRTQLVIVFLFIIMVLASSLLLTKLFRGKARGRPSRRGKR